ERVCKLVGAGCHDLGEARPQALWTKCAALVGQGESHGAISTPVRWHLIGHLQRNKVEPTVPLVSLIHSADSLRLLEAIDQAAAAEQLPVAVLIEVNVSGDETKHGFSPDPVAPAVSAAARLKHISIRGLMCMAAREGDLNVARRNF